MLNDANQDGDWWLILWMIVSDSSQWLLVMVGDGYGDG